jgi:hypothetical protein
MAWKHIHDERPWSSCSDATIQLAKDDPLWMIIRRIRRNAREYGRQLALSCCDHHRVMSLRQPLQLLGLDGVDHNVTAVHYKIFQQPRTNTCAYQPC